MPLTAAQVDTRAGRRVAALAAQEWGVLTRGQLGSCGLSRHEIGRLVGEGWLHRLHRGVYAVGHPNVTLEGRFLAAVKACPPGTVLSGRAALGLYGIIEWEDGDVDVTVPGSSVPQHAGIRVRRSVVLDARDAWRHRGIPVTSPARTLVDAAAVLPHRGLRTAVRRAQALELVHVRRILETMQRLGPRRGNAKLARLIATGPAPTRSVLEDVVSDLILSAGFAHPLVNVPLSIDGTRVIPDFRYPRERLSIEADGARWHKGEIAREDDAERQALLEAHGDRVLRIDWDQAIRRRSQTIARLDAAGAPRVSSCAVDGGTTRHSAI